MLMKKRKSLITLLVAFIAAVLLCFGALLLAPEKKSAHAAGETIYWGISSDGKLTVSSSEVAGAEAGKSGNFASNRIFNNMDSVPWYRYRADIRSAQVEGNVSPVYTSFWFYECNQLTNVDLSSLDTSSVGHMRYMFYGCSGLTSLDLTGFNTANVTDMESMFSGCSGLTSLDLTGFNTANVTGMSRMFGGCSSLAGTFGKEGTAIKISDNFTTANVKYFSYMFSGCRGLTSLDLSGFNTANVTDMLSMFVNCESLAGTFGKGGTAINIGENFTTASVTNMDHIFAGCSGLTTLDLSGFDTAKVTNMSYMFYNCSSLAGTFGKEGTAIKISDTFTTANVTNMSCMFASCSGLTSLDLSGFNAAKVTNMSLMFNTCTNLKEIKVSESLAQKLHDTTNSTYLYYAPFRSTWYDGNGGTYTDENRFSAAGTYTTVQPPFEVTVGTDKSYYSTIEKAFAAASADGVNAATVKMLADTTVNSTLTAAAGKNITLDLNGHKITYAGSSGSVITVNGALTLIDGNTNAVNSILSPVTNQNVEIAGGVITGGKGSGSAVLGGAVFVGNGGTFTMDGGTLAGNTATGGHGGAVRVDNGGTLILKKGSISHNKAGCGGGVCVCDGNFTVQGGEISHNQSTDDGGGVFYENKTDGRKFTFSGGVISDNTAVSVGGGVHLYTGIMEMSGNAKISGNNTMGGSTGDGDGGGVYVNGNAEEFRIWGAPVITGNQSGSAANGVDNVYGKITVAGTLTEGAQIGVYRVGFVASGFTQTTGKASDFFKPDQSGYKCVYASDGNVTIARLHKSAADDNDCTTPTMCTACQSVIAEAPYTSHSFTGSYQTDGEGHWQVCAHEGCNHTNREAHTPESKMENAVSATCSKEGSYDDVKFCKICNYEISRTKKTIAKNDTHNITSIVILTAPAKTEYSAFETLNTSGMVVKTRCGWCGEHIETVTDYSVVYGKGNEMHVGYGVKVSYNDMEAEVPVTIKPLNTGITWQYAENVNAADIDWKNFTGNEYRLTYNADVLGLRNNFRAVFTGGSGDTVTVRSTNTEQSQVWVKDELYPGAIKKAGMYVFKLNADDAAFTDYNFTNNAATLVIDPFEIELNSYYNFYWRLDSIGTESGINTGLRDGFIYYNESDPADPDNFKYFSNGGANREEVKYSIVRNRNKEVAISLYGLRSTANNAEGGVYDIAYGGVTRATQKGRYTATATLTLTEEEEGNYAFIKTGVIDPARNMTVTIDGGTVSITKVWYIAQIDNGLLSQYGDNYGKEWSISGWVYGAYETQYAPRLEHGDPGASGGTVEFGADNNLVTFDLIKTDDPDNLVTVAQGFNRFQFARYINGSVPVGSYTLRVHVSSYTTGEHEHWYEVTDPNAHGGNSAGIYYDAFSRNFDFTVGKADFGTTNVSGLAGKSYSYTYDGNLHLFKDFTLSAPVITEREGVWAEAAYDKYYGSAQLYYNLERWTEGDFVTETGLDGYQNQNQTPKNAGTYKVHFRVRALNYNDLTDDGNYFTVVIDKAVVAAPENVSAVLIKEYVYTVPEDALYRVEGNATFTQAGTHTVTLKLADAANYAWEEGGNVNGDTVTISLTLTMHGHVYGEWTVDEAATCTEAGSRSKKCALCDDEVAEEIPALGHDWEAAFTVDKQPTVTEKGSKSKHCSRCGEKSEVTEIDMLRSQLVKPDDNGGENQVVVTLPEGFSPDIELVVTEIAEENYAQYQTVAESVNGEISLVYDVTLKSDGVAVQPDGTLTIKLLIPVNLNGKNFNIFHMHGGTATEMEYQLDGNYAVVNTDELSEFIFVGEKAGVKNSGLSAGAIAGIVIACVLAALIAAYAAGYFLLYRKEILLTGKVFDAIYMPMNAIFNKQTKE